MKRQRTLTNLTTVKLNGSLLQVALLPVIGGDNYYSDWVAYNGNANEYEIRTRLSHSSARDLKLDTTP